MARDFEIKGNSTEEKFKYLNIILPRLYRKMNPNIITNLPASFSSFFSPLVEDRAFNVLLFKGKILKMAYNIESLNTELQPNDVFVELKLTVIRGDKENSVNVKNKKLTHAADIDIVVNDGDIVRVDNTNPNVTYNNMTFSILYIPDYFDQFVEEADPIIEEEIPDEGV